MDTIRIEILAEWFFPRNYDVDRFSFKFFFFGTVIQETYFLV